MSDTTAEILWHPPLDGSTTIERFAAANGFDAANYESLWEWSTTDLEAFWAAVWQWCDVIGTYDEILTSRDMPGARWFDGAALSYAEHVLRGEGGIIAHSQTRGRVELTAEDLRRQVAACRAGLQRLGVGSGDRVAAWLPNIPEAIVAFLACSSLGAIWTSAAPEFGAQAVVDRFAQIEPKVLLAIDGYRYGDKEIDRRAQTAEVAARLPTVETVVTVPYLGTDGDWDGLLSIDADLEFVAVAPDHPLYILYSSGTTGPPKPIVHGHGGILLEHLKTLTFHADLGPADRFFWFTTTGWMMWNYLVSGLLVGATIVLFDGDPGADDMNVLWKLAADESVTWFGTSAPFLTACRRQELTPARTHDLSALRAVGSTGAPLDADGFRWVYEEVGSDVLLSSISGGTDICSAFVGGNPTTPVRAGEISARYLGAAVDAIDGELVVTAPMPSMPVGFWNDADGSRYRAAYFDAHPGVWSHGDLIEFTDSGGLVISGRSDATLNRGGIRVGSAEIYRAAAQLPVVADSLVVHLDSRDRLVLFVAVVGDERDEASIADEIRRTIAASLSPRHVPDDVVVVDDIPMTLSGKKPEVPVKRVLDGADVDSVINRSSLRNPEAFDALVSPSTRQRLGLADAT